MNPFRWYVNALRRGHDFRGRSPRIEVWSYLVLSIVLTIAVARLPLGSPARLVWVLSNLAPTLAVAFRRLHDSGLRAWWLLILPSALNLSICSPLLFPTSMPGWDLWRFLCSILLVICFLGTLYLLLVRRSTKGDNRFGCATNASLQ